MRSSIARDASDEHACASGDQHGRGNGRGSGGRAPGHAAGPLPYRTRPWFGHTRGHHLDARRRPLEHRRSGDANDRAGGCDFDLVPRGPGRWKMTKGTAYRFAIGAALATACILVWLSLGVGIIGKDGDPANLMYFGVLAVGIVGTLIARLRPHGMARALFAMALAQALVAAIALIARLGLPYSGPAEIVLLNGFFVTMFAGSAWLFRRAAR